MMNEIKDKFETDILFRFAPIFKFRASLPNTYEIELHLYDNLYEDFQLDSLDFVELIMDLEKEFKIQISDEEFEKLSTVLDLIKLIEEKMALRDYTLKELYWRNGNILLTRNNGPVIVAGDIAVGEGGAFTMNDLTHDLKQMRSCSSNDVLEVYGQPSRSIAFNVFNVELVRTYCDRIWKRPEEKKEMTIAEIEAKLGLDSGTLRIKK